MKVIIPVLASILILGAIGLSQDAWAPTKIVPTDGAQPGHPFTIIDTPDGRLADGSVAVFTSGGGGIDVILNTHNSGKTAQGTVPSTPGGTYDVAVRLVDGTTFAVGTFEIDAPLDEASISPTSGPIGTPFTITDPHGRIQAGDLACFYPEGTDPKVTCSAVLDITISSDGTTLSGTVPHHNILDQQFFVKVAAIPALEPSRLAELPFFITS